MHHSCIPAVCQHERGAPAPLYIKETQAFSSNRSRCRLYKVPEGMVEILGLNSEPHFTPPEQAGGKRKKNNPTPQSLFTVS